MVTLVAVAVAYVHFVFNYSPQTVRGMNAILLIEAFAIGAAPLLLRSKPFRLWLVWAVSWGFSLGGSVVRVLPMDIGGPDLKRAVATASAIVMCVFVSWVTYRIAGGHVLRWALLDTATLTLGLILLVSSVAPYIAVGTRTADMTWALYPMMDIMVLGFAGQVLLRGRFAAGGFMGWLGVALTAQIVLDLTHTYYFIRHNTYPPPVITGLFVFTGLALLVAVTRPDGLRLITHPPAPVRVDSAWVRNCYLMAALLTGGIALLIPSVDRAGSEMRSVLVVLLLGLLVTRLVTATQQLSRAEEANRHRARHDPLTGLPNRVALFEDLDERLATNSRAGLTTALLYVDCDSFKDVNDTWGPAVGDRVLRQVARCFEECIGDRARVLRHGGDEFVIITDLAGPEEARALADTVQEHFLEPLPIAGARGYTLTMSIGVAYALPTDTIGCSELLGNADIALHAAKAGGRGQCVVFDETHKERAVRLVHLSGALREAVAAADVQVVYQPMYDGPGYTHLVGWEALARWHHPSLGEIPPAEFVALAEDLDLACELGDHVLRTACREFAQMRGVLGRNDLVLSINVSTDQLLDGGFQDVIVDGIEENNLESSCLVLEVTEAKLVGEQGEVAMEALRELHDTGVQLAIDDFGTGYTSISTLLQLPFDSAKIDRSLVTRLDCGDSSAAQVRAVLNLMRSVGIEVVTAEGVENPEQAAALERLGCPRVQGFHLGSPLSAAAIMAPGEGAPAQI